MPSSADGFRFPKRRLDPSLDRKRRPNRKQQGARLARLYFLREKGLWATEAGIKIDGQPVGSVSKGFYFSVDKPPGRYRITCVNPVSADYEAEVQSEGGQTYYFGIGTPQTSAPAQNLLNQAVSGSSGQQLRSTSLMSGFAGAALYQIDAARSEERRVGKEC